MGQEFHVLRCFSCKTFQVQQVKKSKKWSCKMCGEKQSLMKEYGRGTGADCRRHVQKLNSLRGELLEVENERAWTQWEKEEEECDVKVGHGDETQGLEQKEKTTSVSRWSKYVEQKENGPGCEDDEYEEEQSVYTDTQQWRQHNSIRKRKKSFTSGTACGRYTADEDDDMDTAHWKAKGLPYQPRQHVGSSKTLPQVPRSSSGFPHSNTSQRPDVLSESPGSSLGLKHSADNGIGSQSTRANKHSYTEVSTTTHPSVLSTSFFEPSFSHQHPSETKPETKNSKWARFLPSVSVEENKDVEDGGEHAQYVSIDHSVLADRAVMPVAVSLENTGCTSSGGKEGALLDKMFGVEKLTVLEKLSHCVNGNMCKQPNSPTISSKPVGSQKPVCVQPLPVKRPGPALAFNTLFHTDDDFDDTY